MMTGKIAKEWGEYLDAMRSRGETFTSEQEWAIRSVFWAGAVSVLSILEEQGHDENVLMTLEALNDEAEAYVAAGVDKP